MTAQFSPATLAVSAFAVAIAGFAGGVAITTFLARPIDTTPIVDRDAWNETPPAQPVSYSRTPQLKCNPWEISDVAMEEVLDQMIRRGWRAPTQGAAIAMLDMQGIQAIDPHSPMPSRQTWSPSTSDDAKEAADDDAFEGAAPEPAEVPKDDPPPV